MANPYAIAAAAVIGLGTALWAFHDSTTASEKAQAALNSQIEKQTKSNEEERSSVENLISTIKDDTKTRNEKQKALDALQAKYPAIFLNLDIEKVKNLELANVIREVNEELEKRNGVQSKANIDRAKEIKDLFKTDPSKARNLANEFLGKSWYNFSSNKDLLDGIDTYIQKANEKLLNDAVTASQAEFNNLPKSNRVDILKGDVDKLQAQYDRLKALNKKQKDNPFSSGFSSYTSQMDILESQINAKNSQIKALQEDSEKTATHDKGYWEKQKKDAESRLAVLSDVAAQGKEGDALRKEILGYNKKLKAYDAKDTTNAEESAAQKAIKLAQDQADRELKIENDKIKSKFDLRSQQLENEEKYLNNQQDSFDKQQRQNELNYKKESLALEKHIQDLVETAQKTERDEWDKKNPKGSKTPFKTKISSLSNLSADQQTASIQSDNLNNDAYAKATADTLKLLLNLYQDYNERKRAINEKYDQDLVSLEKSSSQARSEQEKAQIESAIVELKKKWTEALSSVNIDELKESINWEKVFGDLDKVSTQELAKLRDKLKEYISSAGTTLSPQDLKTVTDAYDKLNVDLSQKKPVNELKISYEEYRITLENVAKAKEKLSKLEKGTPAYLEVEKELIDAQNKNDSARVKFAKGIGNTVNKIGEYLEAANALVSTLETMRVSISDSTKQALEGFGQILDGASKLAEGYAEKNPAKMIQGAITQIQGYYNAIVGLFGSGKTLTQKQIDAYKDLLSVLDDVIARQKELLQNSSAKESSKYYQDALDTIDKQREAAKKFLTDDFFESKQNKTGRTYGARERRYIQQDDNQAKLKALGIELKNQYDLLNLTKDEILLIQQKMPEFYANLFDETKDYLQLIVDTEDQTKELGEALQEALTGISFDSLKDSLDDLVQDVDTTFSDIGDSFEDHMRNAVMNFVKNSYLTKALQDWYDKFAEYSTSDNELTKDEITKLREMYEKAYSDAQNRYDSALDAMGVSKENSDIKGITGVAASITQDSADELNGNFYALRQSVNDVRNINKQTQDFIKIQNGHLSEVKEAVNSYKQVFVDQLTYIKMTAENTATTVTILREIRDNGLIMKR